MNHILKMMVMFIVAVAVYDIYCTVHLNDTLLHDEENPIARWFIKTRESYIHINNPISNKQSIHVPIRTVDVSQLVLMKSIGMSLSIPFMLKLAHIQRTEIAGAVIVPIFVAACWLLARLVH